MSNLFSTSALPALPALQTLAVAFILSLPLFLLHLFSARTRKKTKPFPFLKLPSELRNMVYEELAGNSTDREIVYPTKKKQPDRKSIFRFLDNTGPCRPKNWIMLANRQTNREFMDVLCKQNKFKLYVDQYNYKSAELWPISKDLLQTIRTCELWFVTTSNMLGVVDPRFMPKEWALCDRVCEKLQQCKNMRSISLHIRAIGDPLWNPLWVWFQASQAFKTAKNVNLSSIKFSLDSWTLGENHLAKDEDGNWTWKCAQGHFICNDEQRWQPIRDFAASLYQDCEQCHAAQESTENPTPDDV